MLPITALVSSGVSELSILVQEHCMCHDERLAATSGVLQDDLSCLMLLPLLGSPASRITCLSNTSTRCVSQRALELPSMVEATLERLLESGDAFTEEEEEAGRGGR